MNLNNRFIGSSDLDDDDDIDLSDFDANVESIRGRTREDSLVESLISKDVLEKAKRSDLTKVRKEIISEDALDFSDSNKKSASQIELTEYTQEDADDDDDGLPPDNKLDIIFGQLKVHCKSIVLTIVFVAIVIVVCVFTKEPKPKARIETTTSAVTSTEKSIVYDTQTIWGTTSILDYSETVEIPEKYYSDEIIITKFQLIDDSCVQYYFSGIPKHFKKKIVFSVTPTEYNSIASGGKIFIDYKIVKKEGKDYVTDIVTSIKE